ncbi:NAD(P)-dependent alcohol dehydrogenase [Methylobacterium bullatum]|uniref:L-threonine 3-dehydrogenase n=1 Tax=Methylobacterium bullatum TaxID=570505 RepID=A0AAV4ZEK9_9HYPH|nr:NAD(P)-dependent alcohol dehydrogenase [Methylobacterium bullatum]MBD8903613.1 alcohol dehydrogenase [Methylobacterium bullatum]GJD41920.1 L-threonine 3-dehydrogenase [Methylobacterium bullatum]
MRRIEYDRYGGPEVMRLASFELPGLKPSEVAVEVRFAALNPVDWKVRRGDMKIVTGKRFPRAMGCDFSGVVLDVGAGVTRVKPGDAVFGLTNIKACGATAEAVIAPDTFLAKMAEGVSFEAAACLGTPGVTAWNGLVDKARLKAGQHVFINGCTGAVGEAAVQLARMLGAKVSGSCSAESFPRAQAMGLQNVYDYRSTDLAGIGHRYDVVYDTAGTMRIAVGMSLLRRGGVFLDIDPQPLKFVRALFDRRLKPIIINARPDILDALAKASGDGILRLPVAETVPLSQAIPLLTALERGRKLPGKALVSFG